MRLCILEYSYRSSFTYPPSLFHSSFCRPPPFVLQRCMDIVGDVLTDAGVAATEDGRNSRSLVYTEADFGGGW